MKQYKYVIIDAIILVAVSVTIVVVLNNFVFSKLKKNQGADGLVTAIQQDNVDRVKEILSDKEYQKQKTKPATLAEYQKERAAKVDDFGRTPLMWIGYSNNQDQKITDEAAPKRVSMVEVLIPVGIDLNAQDKDGWTGLMWASWSGLAPVVKKLLELNANPILADNKGNTALMLASAKGRLEVVKILLEKNVDKTMKNLDGKTAKDIAVEALKVYPSKAEIYNSIIALL